MDDLWFGNHRRRVINSNFQVPHLSIKQVGVATSSMPYISAGCETMAITVPVIQLQQPRFSTLSVLPRNLIDKKFVRRHSEDTDIAIAPQRRLIFDATEPPRNIGAVNNEQWAYVPSLHTELPSQQLCDSNFERTQETSTHRGNVYTRCRQLEKRLARKDNELYLVQMALEQSELDRQKLAKSLRAAKKICYDLLSKRAQEEDKDDKAEPLTQLSLLSSERDHLLRENELLSANLALKVELESKTKNELERSADERLKKSLLFQEKSLLDRYSKITAKHRAEIKQLKASLEDANQTIDELSSTKALQLDELSDLRRSMFSETNNNSVANDVPDYNGNASVLLDMGSELKQCLFISDCLVSVIQDMSNCVSPDIDKLYSTTKDCSPFVAKTSSEVLFTDDLQQSIVSDVKQLKSDLEKIQLSVQEASVKRRASNISAACRMQ